MKLIRKYKIYKNFNIIDNQTKDIFDFIESNILNLKLSDYKIREWRFYINSNDECIFEYSYHTNKIYFQTDFGNILRNKYNLKTEDIENLLKHITKKNFKIKIEAARILWKGTGFYKRDILLNI